jgi:GT2 family glycosyltransferase
LIYYLGNKNIRDKKKIFIMHDIILAPIVIFAYNRLQHLKQTVESLLKNEYVSESDLIIYSDGYKNEETRKGVEETRKYIQSITGFRSVQVVERGKNRIYEYDACRFLRR